MRLWTEAAAPGVTFSAHLSNESDPTVTLTASSQQLELLLTMDEVSSLLEVLHSVTEKALGDQASEFLRSQ
ncbi:hypothetical protein [Rhodococcus sp. IEGM 1330]|uniref:hypothetical protein n=1 Tax=Rhodococcus sp. IEGM 1330 TaxID=3082225 RepID=UPI002953BA31|nr:hypothetical protein [Rhodococcus sp. IEGM 1330]MDV8024957.1 hypothetical protein [Rhodococcus sp. IEGM 1330]